MADLDYSAHTPLPVLLTRGRANAIELRVYHPTTGAQVGMGAPASPVLVSVFDETGAAVADEATVTMSGDTFTYTVLAAVLPSTKTFSNEWQVRWSLSMPDGAVHVFNEEAYLIRSSLKAPCRTQDMIDAHIEAGDLSGTADLAQKYLTRAWNQIVRRLLKDGRFPHQILDSFSLFEAQLSLGLRHFFLDQHTSVGGDGKYLDLADRYEGLYESEFATMTLRYDVDEDGLPGSNEDGTAEGPSGIWLMGRDQLQHRRFTRVIRIEGE